MPETDPRGWYGRRAARSAWRRAVSDRQTSGRIGLAVGAVVLVSIATPGLTASPVGAAGRSVYVVQAASVAVARSAVDDVGGRVGPVLPIVDGVEAELDSSQVTDLELRRAVGVTPDVAMHFLGSSFGTEGQAPQLARMDVNGLWSSTAGQGVGVALIDTGVAMTPGISRSHLVLGPNFSDSPDNLDRYGHGTFMAGLIAGDATKVGGSVPGVAPGVTLVSVKVAGDDGSTTLGQVIQGIGWAVANKTRYGIRVLSISFGAPLSVDPRNNPLDQAAEVAWAAGITVVAAAGNSGGGHVTSPGDDPWVVTVGAETTSGSHTMPEWSSYSTTKPDVLAPGVSVTSLRAPGSLIDREYPQARVGGSYFRGSGTSMATALTAGAAAILLQHHPDATPDDVKAAIDRSELPSLIGNAGPIDVARADAIAPSQDWWQSHSSAIGVTVMPWARDGWSPKTWEASTEGSPATDGMSWDGMSWDGMSWDGMSWDGMSWDGMSWDGMSWDDRSWG